MIGDGRRVVTTAGSPVPLSVQSVAFRSVTITAETDNTGTIVVGADTVVAAQATRRGTPLAAGQALTFVATEDHVDDLASIYLDATVDGDGVTFTYGAVR